MSNSPTSDPRALTVRTITVFLTDDDCQSSRFATRVSQACSLAKTLRDDLHAASVAVQTTRISLPSPAVFQTPSAALKAAKILEASSIDYVSFGTVHPTSPPSFLTPHFFSELISSTSTVFISLTTTISSGAPSPRTIDLAAAVIAHLSHLEPSGLANMRFAALANVRPNGPFFPASFSSSLKYTDADFRVALGVQASSLLHEGPLSTLSERIESAASSLHKACDRAPAVSFDFSTAPLPGWSTSAAAAIATFAGTEKHYWGGVGSLAAAAAVASAIDRAVFPRAGFCGIMLAVAEDTALAECSNALRLNDLMMASAVCGTGLDMVPLAGDTPRKVLRAIVADVTALSTRLGGKQLAIRLLLVPGRKAGDITGFNSPYLVNGPVLGVENEQKKELEESTFEIEPIRSQ